MTLTLGALDLEPIVDFDGIEKFILKSIVTFRFPGAATSKDQDLGGSSREWTLAGKFESPAEDADLATLRGYYENQTVVSYVDDEGTRDVRVVDFKEKNLITLNEFTIRLRAN